MANKRVSELNELTWNQIAGDDLLLIADVSAIESKRVTADNFRLYAINTGSFSGSFFGTASRAKHSDTASYLLYQGFFNGSASYAISASYALSASYASWATSASYAISASYAYSSAYAYSSSYALTASYVETASAILANTAINAEYSKTASYLLYTDGFMNGTASAAMTASLAWFALSSSFLVYDGITPNGTASYAMEAAHAETASYVDSASYLIYTQGRFNGSASYALSSSNTDWANYVRMPMPWGFYSATINSTTESKIVSMSFTPSDAAVVPLALFEVYGTAYFPYTSSVNESGSILFGLRDSSTLLEHTLDRTWVGFRVFSGDISGAFVFSGSITVPFTLAGQQYMTPGKWTLFVSASTPNIWLDTRRPVKFRVDSRTDNLVVS